MFSAAFRRGAECGLKALTQSTHGAVERKLGSDGELSIEKESGVKGLDE